MTDLCFLPATELQQLLLQRQLSATELLNKFQKQIELNNPVINALVTLDFDRAYDQARVADEHLAKTGQPLGPLHGLPLAVKDLLHVKGMRTTFGNLEYANYISDHDSLVVERERQAGAVIVGKSNTPDFGAGGVTTNEVFGLTRNPWNHRKTTSGSGGGGAAAIAAGLVPLADGSDIGGSVRTPAAWCNCVGFRPSSGRIPDAPDSGADGSICTVGIFSRTVADSVLFMSAVDGPNGKSAVNYPYAEETFTGGNQVFDFNQLDKPVTGKIGWLESFAGRTWASDITRQMDHARSVFEQNGFEVDTIDLQLGDDYRQLYADVNVCAIVRGMQDSRLNALLAAQPGDSPAQAVVERYRSFSSLDVRKIWHDVAKLKVRMQRIMSTYPLVVFPTNPFHAFDVDDEKALNEFDWSTLYLSPMLGLPTVSVPAGFTDDQMPFGLMITGQYAEDMNVLRAAHAFERETGYWKIKARTLV